MLNAASARLPILRIDNRDTRTRICFNNRLFDYRLTSLVVRLLCSGERSVINRRQARYILHTVNEVSRILQTGLGRDQLHDVSVTRSLTAPDDGTRHSFSAVLRHLTCVYHTHCSHYIPVVLAICVVTMPIFCDNIFCHSYTLLSCYWHCMFVCLRCRYVVY